MMNDLRYAFRQLAKSPGFTLVAVLALALGVGANTALFSVVHAIFLRPLPFAAPDRLVHLTSSLPDRNLNHVPFSYPRYQAIRAEQRVFSDMAIAGLTPFTITGHGDPEQVGGCQVSANFFEVLGLQPVLGRVFTADEDRPGGAPVVLISDSYWRKHFNGDPGVIGRDITVDNKRCTIIGVMPPALSRFPFDRTAIWTTRPEEIPYLAPSQLNNGAFVFEVLARLKPGVTIEQARPQLSLLAAGYAKANPKNVDAPATVNVNLWLDDLVGDQRQTYALLLGAVGCVLLIACANVANLLLARFTTRRKEIALRFALGASRRQIVRQLLTESVVLSLAGAAVGVVLAAWGLMVFTSLGRDFIPRATEISLHPLALLFTLAVALATGVAMGLLPALHTSGQDVNDALTETSRGSTQSRAQGRLRSALLVGEIALSLVLLIAASLLLSSFARLQKVSPGFRPERVLVGFLTVPTEQYASQSALAGFYRSLLDRMGTLPGVTSVALNDAPPLSGNNNDAPIAVVGRPIPPLGDRALAIRHLVSPGSFTTLGMALRAGRDFNARDNLESPQTVIINEAMARQFFGTADPIGQRIITGMGQITAEIVGVVSDTRSVGLNTPPRAEYFLPVLQRPERFTALLVQTQGDPGALAGAVRAALREVDPTLPLNKAQTMTALVARSVADRKLVMVLLAVFAAVALLLASIGVYSVMAYIVSQRTSEIGIRVALGATPGRVQSMVLAQGMKLVGTGVGSGLVAAFATTQLLKKLLFEVRPTDPAIYAALTVFICGVAACACWLPARRATRIDPLVALRAT